MTRRGSCSGSTTPTQTERGPVAEFVSGEQRWIEQLGDLRNVIRQELIRRQLKPFAKAGMAVLDIGSGQGTQAIELARAGCEVTCIEPSAQLQALCRSAASEAGLSLIQLTGTLDDAAQLCDPESFDIVCAHGLLMYLSSRSTALGHLSHMVRPGGLLSIAFRNADGIAARPGMRRQWAEAIVAMSADGSDRYSNGIGVEARADRLADVQAHLAAFNVHVQRWFGVRVFNDAVAHGSSLPPGEHLAELLDAEEQAGATDPYRWFGSLIHVVAQKNFGTEQPLAT